jgi:hypothetical protein
MLIGVLDPSLRQLLCFLRGLNQFQLVTELVEEILVDITCALLMMEATMVDVRQK